MTRSLTQYAVIALVAGFAAFASAPAQARVVQECVSSRASFDRPALRCRDIVIEDRPHHRPPPVVVYQPRPPVYYRPAPRVVYVQPGYYGYSSYRYGPQYYGRPPMHHSQFGYPFHD